MCCLALGLHLWHLAHLFWSIFIALVRAAWYWLWLHTFLLLFLFDSYLLITLPLGGFVFNGMAASPFVLSTYIRTTLWEKWDGGHKNVPWWLLMVNNSINDEKSTENMERRRGGKKKVERTPTKKIGTKKTYSEENILWSVCICGGWASFFFFFFFLLVLQNNLIVLLQY